MSAVALRRLFGRSTADPATAGSRTDRADRSSGRLAPGWSGLGAGAPARTGPRGGQGRWAGGLPTDDPPTDPIGFAPLLPGISATSDGRRAYPRWAEPPPPPVGPPAVPGPTGAGHGPPDPERFDPDPAEAGALAAAFAADYLSWDEDDPGRRAQVLHDYLADPGADPGRLGWSGRGRQRSDLALPGRVSADGESRVLVDVRVRVVPYRAVGDRGGRQGEPPAEATVGVPAGAPAPTARGWRSLAATWVRLSVPITVERGRLVVDATEETLGLPPPPGDHRPDPAKIDTDTERDRDVVAGSAVADDDPHPWTGGAR